MDSAKILLIGDEPNILRTLRRNLSARGYEVDIAFDGQEACELTAQCGPDLLVLHLDFTNPQVDGFVVCAHLRQMSQSPIIVLSALAASETKVKALDLGADDYVVLPFVMDEFLARVRSALRRWSSFKNGSNARASRLLVGDLLIDTESREVNIRGEAVKLTPHEYDLLLYLAQRSGKVVTHRELLKAVWGNEYGDEREYLRVFISQVRRKIEDDPLHPVYILTEPGVGYRFAADSH